MAIRHQILWLIHTLYCVAIIQSTLLDINDAKFCDLLCKQCNGSAVMTDNCCECNFPDNYDKVKCIKHIEREIQAVDLNILSEDLMDEERAIRCILKSRHRLKMDILGNSLESEFHGKKPLNSAISWHTCGYQLYIVPETELYTHPAVSNVETPIIGMTNPALSYQANRLYDATNPLVGSIIHPRKPGHGLFHHTHRTGSLSEQILYNLFHPHRRYHHYPGHRGSFFRSSNAKPVDPNVVSFLGSPEAALYSIQRSHIFSTNRVYEPQQYQHFNIPYQYTSYHNPLINKRYPVTNKYTVQPEYNPQYGISDPLISLSDPNCLIHSSTNNVNAKQNDEISTDKIVQSNNEAEQSNNVTETNISKEENKTENNENNKS
ncbi:uncharacterized protein [Anoplolepis gracilipes]|uniref:uncharacterized protein isoform X2 n=1 Tax=Anoplolepis gracilipes TaxID=354296 RepID=UPI003BA24771